MKIIISDPPSVMMRMEPGGVVSEEDHANVSLHCDMVAGNPLDLTRVFWYLDGELLRVLPDYECEEDGEIGSGDDTSDDTLAEEEFTLEDEGSGGRIQDKYFCKIDPKELILQDVTRHMAGNFSCVGSSNAGSGKASQPQQLLVHCGYHFHSFDYLN